MDSVGGARILCERFGGAEPAPFPTVQAVDALPLFHWTGVEPMVAPLEPLVVDEPVPPRRWRRARRAA